MLDRFVGTWDFVVTIKPRGGQAATGKTSETRVWSRGGRFVHFENLQIENPDEPHLQMLVTYDAEKKTYPGVLMVGASRSVLTGRWDRESSTMTFEGSSVEDGGTFVFKNHFIDDDHCEATGVLKDASGDIFLELVQQQTRRAQ